MKKIWTMLLSSVFVFTTATTALASDSPVLKLADSSQVLSIKDLYQQKSELLTQSPIDQVKIAEIDTDLKGLGVDFLTQEQVNEKSNTTVGELKGFTPQIAVPSQSNISWSSYRDTVTRQGVTYEVQHLVAQPNGLSSNLAGNGNTTIKSSYGWQAGAMNFLLSAGKTATGKIIPGASNVLSVYNALSAFSSGLQSTSTITNLTANYTWNHTTMVSFEYVKQVGQADDSQILTYVSSSVTTWVNWAVPSFTINSGTASASGASGSKYIYSTPDGFDNTYNAAWAYADVNAPKNDKVGTVTISGPESKAVVNIYPLSPSFPPQVY
jgi:hypothetical protein